MKKNLQLIKWALFDRTLDYDDQGKYKLSFRESWGITRGHRQAFSEHFLIKKQCGCRFRWWGTRLLFCLKHANIDPLEE